MSSRWKPSLDRSWSTDRALATVLIGWLDLLEANRDGVLEDRDVECLHDLRVALRRSRALVSACRFALPDGVRRHADELAWLGRRSGGLRDLDVLLLAWPRYIAAIGSPPSADRARQSLERHRRATLGHLRRTLRSQREQRMRQNWRSFLDTELGRASRSGSPPITETASRALEKAAKRVRKAARKLPPASPDETVHELRIRCKKLRYVLEAFAALERGTRDRLVVDLKRLQDVLGEFNDVAVHQQIFTERLGRETAEQRLLRDGLLTYLNERQGELRRRLAPLVARFAEVRPGAARRYG